MILTCWLLSTLCLMPTDTHIAPLLSVNKGKVHWLFSVQYLVYSTNHTQLAWSVTLGHGQYVAMEPLPVCCRHAKQLLCQRSEHNYDKLKSEKKKNSSINTAIGHKMSHQHGSDIRITLGSIVGLNHVDIQKTISNFIFVFPHQTVLKHLQNHYWWKTASLIQRIMNV